MHTLEIPRKKGKSDEIEFPSNWEEMTEKQFLKVMELVVLFENGEIDYNDFKLQSCMILIGIVKTDAPRSKADQEEIECNLAILAELLDFMIVLEENKKKQLEAKLKFDCLKQFVPEINGFVGPDAGLSNLSWVQLTYTSAHYKMYIQTKNIEHLDKLVAGLYLPKDSNFEVENIDARIKDLSEIPFHHKYYVFLFFRNSLMYMQSTSVNMNGEMVDLSILFKDDKKKSKADGLGLVGLQMGVAEAGVFGDMEKVGGQNIYDVYAYLYKNKFAHLEAVKAQKRQEKL